MKKFYLLSLVLFSVLNISCSRKVHLNKSNIELKKDSIVVLKKDSIATIKTNINLIENSEEIEIKPIIDSLPMVIDGKTYFNTVLRHKKTNIVLSNTKDKTVVKNTSKSIQLKKQENISKKEKDVKSISYINYIIYIFSIILFIILYKFIFNKIYN